METGRRRVFATVLAWPGWCRSGRDEAAALETLAAARARYRPVAALAGLSLPDGGFDVVERVAGGATTDFGAPEGMSAGDREPWSPGEADRTAALLRAVWATLDGVAATAPLELRRGPRGGGRDRDGVVAHVLGAESAYARKCGLRERAPAPADAVAVAAFRARLVDAISGTGAGSPAGSWPPRYAARRIAWHVLDHAWEIEDRSPG